MFASAYTARQREAIARAKIEERMSAAAVVQKAAAGQLELDGEPLPAFHAARSSVDRIARKFQREQEGLERSALEGLESRDAVEQLRVRLVRAVDHETRRVEERQRNGDAVSAEHLRQLGRATRELAGIPAPDDARPVAPGQRDPETGEGFSGATRGGLGARVLEAARRAQAAPTGPVPAPVPPSEPEPEPEVGSEEWKRRAGEKLAAELEARWRASLATSEPDPEPEPPAFSAPEDSRGRRRGRPTEDFTVPW